MNYNALPLDPKDPTGTDLAIDQNGDLILTPQGDAAMVGGIDNIKQMIRVRLQTRPDSYLFGRDLGSELGKTIDAPLNPTNRKLIQQYTANALLVDQRVSRVNSVDVIDPNDGSMQFFLTVNVTVVGLGDVQTTVSIGGVSGV